LQPDNGSPSSFDTLLQLLDGTIQKNSRGSHMLVRRLFEEPRIWKVDRGALHLLVPDHSDPVCDPGRWLFLDTETTGLSGGTGT